MTYVLFTYVAMVPMFVLRRLGPLDFWWWMAANGAVLTAAGWAADPELRRELSADLRCGYWAKIAGGLASAVALGVVFALGNVVLRSLVPAAGDWIARIYQLRDQASSWRIGLLLLFVIGPAEEIVWRGVVQRGFVVRFGPRLGIAMAVAAYTGIHVATGNPVLLLAAVVAGIWWGWMYHRWRSLTANAVSHAVWDVMVFVLAPFH